MFVPQNDILPREIIPVTNSLLDGTGSCLNFPMSDHPKSGEHLTRGSLGPKFEAPMIFRGMFSFALNFRWEKNENNLRIKPPI